MAKGIEAAKAEMQLVLKIYTEQLKHTKRDAKEAGLTEEEMVEKIREHIIEELQKLGSTEG